MIDRVALFVTCLADTLYPQVGRATVTVLERLGIEVVFPLEQTCCGQMHANSGYPDEAEQLARRFVEIFAGFDAVVTPSGSCAAQVREHIPALLGGDDRGVPARTWELSQFLTGVLGVEDVGSRFEGTVAYHPTCHSLRLLRVGDAPLRLLRAVPGVELIALPDAEECCGFGGTFAVKNADVSAAMLDEKLAAIVASGADSVCACDSSCLMHIGGGLRRRGLPVCADSPGRDPRVVSGAERDARPEAFPLAAAAALANRQVRANVGHATTTIRAKRAAVVAEVPDWEELRAAAAAIKDETLGRLDEVLLSWRRRCRRPAAPCTGRVTPPRRTRSWSGSSVPRAPTRW